MAFRDQPLGELALTIPRAPPCSVNTIWITAAAANRRWRAPHRAKRWMSR